MALVGYFIVFSFVTKPGQTLEFLLWGTIVPLNFLAGYYCSIVASTPQPMAYAFINTYMKVVTIMNNRNNNDHKQLKQLCTIMVNNNNSYHKQYKNNTV